MGIQSRLYLSFQIRSRFLRYVTALHCASYAFGNRMHTSRCCLFPQARMPKHCGCTKAGPGLVQLLAPEPLYLDMRACQNKNINLSSTPQINLAIAWLQNTRLTATRISLMSPLNHHNFPIVREPLISQNIKYPHPPPLSPPIMLLLKVARHTSNTRRVQHPHEGNKGRGSVLPTPRRGWLSGKSTTGWLSRRPGLGRCIGESLGP